MKDGIPAEEDHWAEFILDKYTKFSSSAYRPIMAVVFLIGPVSVGLFYTFISSSFSNVVAYAVFVISLFFILISIFLLGWILD